jgi:hypothetical protein
VRTRKRQRDRSEPRSERGEASDARTDVVERPRTAAVAPGFGVERKRSLGSAPMLAANVWHWWISVPLVGGAVLAIIGTVVGYFVKMNQLKYPNGRRK